ncbi:MAG: Gfo/Idh/MocA family oxidoreductase [Candidatus Brocadiia bacterium]|nr:MAG: Gfo/Idh/MocA family oxidoreductase [Candidatus Brocadiia bacterium]
MKSITRRDFVKGSVLAGLALALPHSRIFGANEDIRVAVVGFRGQGGGHIKRFLGIPGVKIVALCDVDKNVIAGQVAEFEKRNEKVDVYTDVRKLLEDKNIDAISIATPNHWHALISIWACQAGKDVYVEKPVSHNIYEGRKIVEAARKYNRIVQAGTHKRSDTILPEVFEYLQKDNIGKIKLARGFCYKGRKSIGKVAGIQPIPESVDYNLWTGPAPLVPLMREKLHYDWHWVWPTGNGDFGNQGVHEVDLCRWAIGQNTLPERVMSIGGRFGYDDDGTTPNTQIAILDYKPAPIIFEVRGLPFGENSSEANNYKGIKVGIVVECEGGYFAGGGGGGWVYDNNGNKVKQFLGDGGGKHQDNFIKAVRSRKGSDLNCDILEGHLSSALCHMSNISYRLGTKVGPEKIREGIKASGEFTETFGRFQSHLEANKVNIEETPAVIGAALKMDPKKEMFVGEFPTQWANELLNRDYRKPFIVPDQV